MQPEIYIAMAHAEDTHWWFRGRRAILRNILKNLKKPNDITILDVGCGTGGNLALLSEFGKVFAMEMEPSAREFANARNIVKVEEGMLPNNIPFRHQYFDLIGMFDVLEHIEEDYNVLLALRERLAPGGQLLLTVPAFEFLWSMHDITHHHKRRYSLAPLVRLLERAGYKVTFCSYINFCLFPLIALVRIIDRLTNGTLLSKKQHGNAELFIPKYWLNNLLERIFAMDYYLQKIMRLPFGVSIVLLAQKA